MDYSCSCGENKIHRTSAAFSLKRQGEKDDPNSWQFQQLCEWVENQNIVNLIYIQNHSLYRKSLGRGRARDYPTLISRIVENFPWRKLRGRKSFLSHIWLIHFPGLKCEIQLTFGLIFLTQLFPSTIILVSFCIFYCPSTVYKNCT